MKANFSIGSKGLTVQRLLDALNACFNALGVNSVTCVRAKQAIATTETKIGHTLGTVPTGWREFNKEANATVWQSRPADAQFVYLQASSAVVVGIEVF